MIARKMILSLSAKARLRRASRMSVRWRYTRYLAGKSSAAGPRRYGIRSCRRSNSAATRHFWLRVGKAHRLAEFRERNSIGWVWP